MVVVKCPLCDYETENQEATIVMELLKIHKLSHNQGQGTVPAPQPKLEHSKIDAGMEKEKSTYMMRTPPSTKIPAPDFSVNTRIGPRPIPMPVTRGTDIDSGYVDLGSDIRGGFYCGKSGVTRTCQSTGRPLSTRNPESYYEDSGSIYDVPQFYDIPEGHKQGHVDFNFKKSDNQYGVNSRPRRKIKTYIFVGVTIILIIALAVATGFLFVKINTILERISLTEKDVLALDNKTKTNKDQIGAMAEEVLAFNVKVAIFSEKLVKLENRSVSEVVIESKIAAHSMLDVQKTKLNSNNQNNPQDNPLVWLFEYKGGTKPFLGAYLTYNKGKIMIGKTGIYHVYSQVRLDTNDNPLTGEEIITFAVVITSDSRPKDGVLMNSQITMKNGEVRGINTEGTFMLSKGDEISVYISKPSILQDIPDGNTFGLFML